MYVAQIPANLANAEAAPSKGGKKTPCQKVEKTNNNQTVTEELTTHQMNK